MTTGKAKAKRWFTVMLLYPDYMTDDYGETYTNYTQATDPEKAVIKVQRMAKKANPVYEDMDPNDFRGWRS